MFPTRFFPNPKHEFLAIFYYPKPVLVLTNKPGYFETPGIGIAFKYCMCSSDTACVIAVVLIKPKLWSAARNGRITTFELSAIITMRGSAVLLLTFGDVRYWSVYIFVQLTS